MRRALIGLAMLVLVAVPAASAPRPAPSPPASAGPKAYVRWIYGRYTAHASFDPLAPYSPAMRSLFARNSKLLGDEVGENNDGDEFCQCQDWERLKIDRLRTVSGGPDRATIEVGFTDLGRHEAVTLQLAKTAAGWRVDDVLHPRQGASASLRARLQDENRRLASKRR